MGRPLVIVQEDYESLPELDVAMRNVSEGAARDIEFEFSVPIKSSNGFVVSDLPYFKYGLDFLPPHGEITCYWDELDSLLPFLESKDLRACADRLATFHTCRFSERLSGLFITH
jgi:hypothetical protein